jgi:hypothetical protein
MLSQHNLPSSKTTAFDDPIPDRDTSTRRSEHLGAEAMTKLPEKFSVLSSFIESWALPTRAQRFQKRVTTRFEDIKEFYEAMLPRMDEIVQHLNTFPISDRANLPMAEANLLMLALSFMEVAISVECFKASDNSVLDPAKTEIWL